MANKNPKQAQLAHIKKFGVEYLIDDGTWSDRWAAAQEVNLPKHRIDHTANEKRIVCTCGQWNGDSMEEWSKHASAKENK